MQDIYAYKAALINGDDQSLEIYRGKVMLLVNTASQCGFTDQYKGLEALYQQYKEQGLVVLGFPCNQFGKQEPGSSAEISEFCEFNFGVTFPLFAKLEVNGDNTHPLFAYLKQQAPGILGTQKIKWNFTKFLVARDGRVVKRYAPKDKPESLNTVIAALL